MSIPQLLQLGMQYRIAGRFGEAAKTLNQVLQLQPEQPDALHQLGIASAQQGQFDQAEQYLRRAIASNQNQPVYHAHLGNVLSSMSRFDDAISCYRKSLQLKSDDPVTWYNFGNALLNSGQNEEAIQSFQKAIKLKPDYALAYNALGNTYFALDRFTEMLPAFQEAYQLNPNIKELSGKLGKSLALAGRVKEAIPHLEKAFADDPESEDIPLDLAKSYDESDNMVRGITFLNQVVTKKPQFVDALLMLSNFYTRAGLLDDAIKISKQVLQINPNNFNALSDLGTIHAYQGELDQAFTYFEQAIKAKPDSWQTHSVYLYYQLFDPNKTNEQLAEAHRLWNEKHAAQFAPVENPKIDNPDPDRKLRIGYVSGDFRDHVIGRNLLPIYWQHDHQQFEIYSYSSTLREDDTTDTFEKYSDYWRDIRRMTDEEVARKVKEDKIDILVDLTMHLSGSRMMIFARKPAPIQFTFAAYPGTTGLKTIDYRLSDPYLDPEGENDQFYSEKTIRLPDTFWCFQEPSEEPAVNDLPAIKNGYVTFGCLNSSFKINPLTLNLWARVLNSLPDSRLLLLSSPGSHWDRTQDFFESQGITRDRIVLVKRNKRSVYLANYHQIDLGLDSFPYNGHSTSLDSYWMGVPVVTLTGKTVVSRAGFSQLNNLGLTDLIAQNEEDFVKIVSSLAGDLDRLKELRSSLRDRLKRSTLMDQKKFTRGIEDAYRNAWKSAVGGI